MQEFKGTPGPWFACPCNVRLTGSATQPIFNDGRWIIGTELDSDRLPLAEVDRGDDLHEPTRKSAEYDARLIAAAPELLEAALFAERRSKQPGEGDLEFFERLADEFYRRHGYLAPGKDDPLRSVSIEEARREWGRFLNEPGEARRAAIAKALNTDTTER